LAFSANSGSTHPVGSPTFVLVLFSLPSAVLHWAPASNNEQTRCFFLLISEDASGVWAAARDWTGGGCRGVGGCAGLAGAVGQFSLLCGAFFALARNPVVT